MKQRADLKNRLKMKQGNDFIGTNREKFNIVIKNFGKFNGFWAPKISAELGVSISSIPIV